MNEMSAKIDAQLQFSPVGYSNWVGSVQKNPRVVVSPDSIPRRTAASCQESEPCLTRFSLRYGETSRFGLRSGENSRFSLLTMRRPEVDSPVVWYTTVNLWCEMDLIAVIVHDKYPVGPSVRSICARCCFTMTNVIQVCTCFHWARGFIIDTPLDKIRQPN